MASISTTRDGRRSAIDPQDGAVGVLKRQCLDRRIDNRERRRNFAGAHLKWMFTTEKARTKMACAYLRPADTLDQPAKES